MEREKFDPGWYKDISNERYHGSMGVSSTRLKDYLKMVPNNILYKKPMQTSDAMKLGTVVHEAVLEGVSIEDKYVAIPDFGDLRKKANKEEKLKFIEDNQDLELLTPGMYQDALGMSESIKSNPECASLLDGSINESSVYWWHKALDEDNRDYKVMCKVRPDAISLSHPGVLLDVKTTDNATETEFARTMVKFDYHMSAAMYLAGVNSNEELLSECGAFFFTTFMFLVVENHPPYNSRVFKMSSGNKTLNLGKARFYRAVQRYHDAKENDYPGYGHEINEIEVPSWAEKFHII